MAPNLTPDQDDELRLVRIANPKGKLALGLDFAWQGYPPAMAERMQGALERLQLRRWLVLIDVTHISTPASRGEVMRVFLLSEEARLWRNEHADNFTDGERPQPRSTP